MSENFRKECFEKNYWVGYKLNQVLLKNIDFVKIVKIYYLT